MKNELKKKKNVKQNTDLKLQYFLTKKAFNETLEEKSYINADSKPDTYFY